MKASIVLIGPMGSGKSAAGRAVARRLGRPFVEVDEAVEAETGRSVAEIFAEEGEGAFRALEAAAVREAARIPQAVIACGGGVVLDPDNVVALRSCGLVLYLKVSPGAAARRVGDGKGRPLLSGGKVEARLTEIINERSYLYEGAADRQVDADLPLDAVIAAVLEAVPVLGVHP
ncbi:MAG: shikimate kinase [Actinomycetota bacterium]